MNPKGCRSRDDRDPVGPACPGQNGQLLFSKFSDTNMFMRIAKVSARTLCVSGFSLHVIATWGISLTPVSLALSPDTPV